jgi:hypothetical protein
MELQTKVPSLHVLVILTSIMAVLLTWMIGLISIPVSSIDQRLSSGEAEVSLENCVGQTFLSERPDLARIDLSLVARGHAEGTVTLEVREGGPAGSPMRTVTRHLTAPNVDSPFQRRDPYQRFSFAPVPDSRGKLYALCVELSDLRGGPFLVRFHEVDIYPQGARYEGDREVEGDLTFRVYHAQGLVERLRKLGRRFAQDRPGVLGRPITYVLLLGLYLAGTLGLLGWAARCLGGCPHRPGDPMSESKGPQRSR